jgi:hypothetical protein
MPRHTALVGNQISQIIAEVKPLLHGLVNTFTESATGAPVAGKNRAGA